MPALLPIIFSSVPGFFRCRTGKGNGVVILARSREHRTPWVSTILNFRFWCIGLAC